MKLTGKRILVGTLLLGAGAIVTLLYLFAPDQHTFYPRCLLNAITGLQCPGCGGLRAGHALLHGDLGAAFRFNPLLVLLIPPLFWILAVATLRHLTGRRLPNPFVNPWCGWTTLLLLVLFAITRNL